jgi:hypothetical protein
MSTKLIASLFIATLSFAGTAAHAGGTSIEKLAQKQVERRNKVVVTVQAHAGSDAIRAALIGKAPVVLGKRSIAPIGNSPWSRTEHIEISHEGAHVVGVAVSEQYGHRYTEPFRRKLDAAGIKKEMSEDVEFMGTDGKPMSSQGVDAALRAALSGK